MRPKIVIVDRCRAAGGTHFNPQQLAVADPDLCVPGGPDRGSVMPGGEAFDLAGPEIDKRLSARSERD